MYLVFVVLLGIPLLMSEMNVGRIGRGGPAQSMRVVATESDASTKGGALGGWMVISSFLILTCYVVASGWVLDYAIHSFSYGFSHMSEAAHSQLLNLVTKDPHQMLVISAQ
jgi:NSS family neurotransmitter:Na+ symporter